MNIPIREIEAFVFNDFQRWITTWPNIQIFLIAKTSILHAIVTPGRAIRFVRVKTIQTLGAAPIAQPANIETAENMMVAKLK